MNTSDQNARTEAAPPKPRIGPKVRPEARVVQHASRYRPELDAYGLRENEAGDIVSAIACPDIEPAKVMRDARYEIDARLWEGKFRNGRLIESQVTPRLNKAAVQARYTQLRESLGLRESDWFATGGMPGASLDSPLTANYVPAIPGPSTRQQYWADYWMSSAKCFEASTHSGVARRACKAMVNFPLSRGVQWKIDDQAAQDAWEEFWNANKMRTRIRSIFYDLSVYGEQFLRYFPTRRGQPGHLIIRQLDPATIYEIVTDQEDLETVFFYHQQYQTRMELYSPPRSNRAPEGPTLPGVTRYIIRQIPYEEVDHYKIHTVAGEARGRSDLFPILADLKRLRDLLTSKVVQHDLLSRMMGILTANGTGADLTRVLNSIFPNGQPPAPGTIIALNDAVDLKPFEYNSAGVREDFTYEELVDNITAGTGISRADLGLAPAKGAGSTQATALTAEASGNKTYEERQLLVDDVLHDMFDRVMAAAGINRSVEVQFILPELVKEDRSQKLQDLTLMEANGWISKQTAATNAAADADLSDYDFDEEMKLLIAEFADADETDGKDEQGNDKPARGEKIRRPVISAASRQVPKLDPTKAQSQDDEPMGQLVGGVQQPGEPQQMAKGGISAKKSTQAQSNTLKEADLEDVEGEHLRRTPDDPEFTEHADEYTRRTEKNLKRVLAEIGD